jgi:hypothetical protein
VIVDDVEEDAEPQPVGSVHQPAQPPGASVGRLRGVEMHAVVAPVARAGKLGHRHELDGCHPEVHELLQVRDDRLEGAGRREGAHVQLVEDQVGQRVTAEGLLVGPREARGIHHDGGAVDPLGLEAGDRIWAVAVTVQPVLIAGAGAEAGDRALEEAVLAGRERLRVPPLDDDVHRPAARRPHSERGAGLVQGGAEMKACAKRIHTVQ